MWPFYSECLKEDEGQVNQTLRFQGPGDGDAGHQHRSEEDTYGHSFHLQTTPFEETGGGEVSEGEILYFVVKLGSLRFLGVCVSPNASAAKWVFFLNRVAI